MQKSVKKKVHPYCGYMNKEGKWGQVPLIKCTNRLNSILLNNNFISL